MKRRPLLLLSIGGTGLLTIGLFVDRSQTFHAYLTAYSFLVSLGLGCLLLRVILEVAGAGWLAAIRSSLWHGASLIPLSGILFLPILFGIADLYPWADGGQGAYFRTSFFALRSLFYLGCWAAIYYFLPRTTRFQAAYLPILGLTMTFASFDWLMSLTPGWFSSIYGLYFFSGSFVAAVALATWVYAARSSPQASVLYALGRLLFAFVAFWAYIAFVQALLVYLADKPQEVPWYLERTRGAWRALTAILIIGHFLIPFFLLLSRDIKMRPRDLGRVAAWLLLMHYADLYYQVAPAGSPGPHWLDVAAPAGLLGGATIYLWRKA